MRKLYRSEKEKMIAGVFGGLGEYFNVDPTVFRLLGVLVLLATGVLPGIVFYILAVMVVPKQLGETTDKK